MRNLVVLENVVKSYRMGRVDVFALRGVDFSGNRGETIGIAGPSGSGKTTLLNIIAGVDRPTAGNVLVNGQNVAYLSDRELDVYRRDFIGYIFQFFNLVPTLSSLQNVELPMVVKGTNSRDSSEKARALLRLVDMEGRAAHLPAELSGGEQQRVAIAVALANDPPLVLADEPTGELDSETGGRVIDTLFSSVHKTNKTLIVVSHDAGLLRKCRRVLTLRNGRILARTDSMQEPGVS